MRAGRARISVSPMSHVAEPVPDGPRDRTFTTGRAMGWLTFVSSLFWPRLFILGFWIFSDLLGRAYDSALVPIVGFLVLPWTTLVYAMAWGRSSDRVFGVEWLFVAVAVALDIGTYLGWRALRR
jgi:hypothetical protein